MEAKFWIPHWDLVGKPERVRALSPLLDDVIVVAYLTIIIATLIALWIMGDVMESEEENRRRTLRKGERN